MTWTSTFSNPDAQEVQEPQHYFSKQMVLKCDLLSVLTFLGQKKKVKKKILWTGRCGQLMPVSSWWLWMCPYSQHAFEIPSICLYCERIKNWGLLLTDGSLCSEYREGCLSDYRGKTAWMVAWIVHCPTRCGGLAPGVKTWHSPWPRGSPLLRGEGNWCAGVGLRDQESLPAFCYHAPRGLKSPGS